jgi:hypothetical protein
MNDVLAISLAVIMLVMLFAYQPFTFLTRLNEFSYDAPPSSVIWVVMVQALILFLYLVLATWGTAFILVTYFAPLLLEQEVSLIYHIASDACWALIALFGTGMLYLMFVRLKNA